MTTATATRTFTVEDNTIEIYPKLANGKSIRVVVIRRKLTSSDGVIFHICHNAGKWSYRIDYPFKSVTTRMCRKDFIAEIRRMGGANKVGLFCATWSTV